VRLITAHRILIGTGIAFFVFYSAWQARHWMASGAAGDVVQSVVAAAVAVGLVVYYRSLDPQGPRRPPPVSPPR
jgi:hypothetical protein